MLEKPTKDQLLHIEQLSREGKTLETIAGVFGMTARTLQTRRKQVPELQEAISKGKAAATDIVVGMLWKMILDEGHKGHVSSVFFYLKTQAGWSETQVIEQRLPASKGAVTKVASKKVDEPKDKAA